MAGATSKSPTTTLTLFRHEQLSTIVNAYVQDMTLLPDIEDAIYTTIEHGRTRWGEIVN